MLALKFYLALYKTVFNKELKKYDVGAKEIKTVFRSIEESFSNPTAKSKVNISYDDPACRCAYLHEYAAFHTYIVQDMFQKALTESEIVFMPSCRRILNICSIGGGPGIDIVAMLSVLIKECGVFRWSAQIIENVFGWKDTLTTTIKELQKGFFVPQFCFSPPNFDWTYLVKDQLRDDDGSVAKAICSADLILMPRFCSSTVDVETAQLIKLIFTKMHPGAVFFFIGSSHGGGDQVVNHIGQECGMVSAFGPWTNVPYEYTRLKRKKTFGDKGCFRTEVSAHLLMKPYTYTVPYGYGFNQFPTRIDLQPNAITSEVRYAIHPHIYPGHMYGYSQVVPVREDLRHYSLAHKSKEVDGGNLSLEELNVSRCYGYFENGSINSKSVIKSWPDVKINRRESFDSGIVDNTDVFNSPVNVESKARNRMMSNACFGYKPNAISRDSGYFESGSMSSKSDLKSWSDLEIIRSRSFDSGIVDNTELLDCPLQVESEAGNRTMSATCVGYKTNAISRDSGYFESGSMNSKSLIKPSSDLEIIRSKSFDSGIVDNTEVFDCSMQVESKAGNRTVSATRVAYKTNAISRDSGYCAMDMVKSWLDAKLHESDTFDSGIVDDTDFFNDSMQVESEARNCTMSSKCVGYKPNANLESSDSSSNQNQSLSSESFSSSESEELDSSHDYPLYELFPKDEINISPNGNRKTNEPHFSVVKSSQTTDKSVNTKSIWNDVVEVKNEQNCLHCNKLRRINWLQNKCRFCKSLDSSDKNESHNTNRIVNMT